MFLREADIVLWAFCTLPSLWDPLNITHDPVCPVLYYQHLPKRNTVLWWEANHWCCCNWCGPEELHCPYQIYIYVTYMWHRFNYCTYMSHICAYMWHIVKMLQSFLHICHICLHICDIYENWRGWKHICNMYASLHIYVAFMFAHIYRYGLACTDTVNWGVPNSIVGFKYYMMQCCFHFYYTVWIINLKWKSAYINLYKHIIYTHACRSDCELLNI